MGWKSFETARNKRDHLLEDMKHQRDEFITNQIESIPISEEIALGPDGINVLYTTFETWLDSAHRKLQGEVLMNTSIGFQDLKIAIEGAIIQVDERLRSLAPRNNNSSVVTSD